MLIFSSLLSLFLLASTASSTYHRSHCLSSSSASHLAQRWLRLRSTSPTDPSFSSLVGRTLTSDSTHEDETISYFIPPGGINQTGPFARSREEYVAARQVGLATSTTTVPLFRPQKDVKGGGVRFGCDSITVRWISSSVVNVEVP